jgi:site-specific recombinase XerD
LQKLDVFLFYSYILCTMIPLLSKDRVADLFCATANVMDRLLLMIAYSSGLSAGAVTCLRVADVEPQERRIRVPCCGMSEDGRFRPLSPLTAQTCTTYLSTFPVKTWLFSTPDGKDHLSLESAEDIFRRTLAKVGIHEPLSIECLQLSFRAHLLEQVNRFRASVARPSAPHPLA